jgi:hypothetical protein
MPTSDAGGPSVLARQLAQLPADRVVQLRGGAAEDIASTLAEATVLPSVVSCHARAAQTSTAFVHAVLDDLEAVAIGLFPAWLPDAEHIRVPGGAGLAAVQALAATQAARSAHFGPSSRISLLWHCRVCDRRASGLCPRSEPSGWLAS